MEFIQITFVSSSVVLIVFVHLVNCICFAVVFFSQSNGASAVVDNEILSAVSLYLDLADSSRMKAFGCSSVSLDKYTIPISEIFSYC